MSIFDVTICREGEGKMIADFLPPPVCYAHFLCHVNPDRVQGSQEAGTVTFFAPADYMDKVGGLVSVLDLVWSLRQTRGDRVVIEAAWKAEIKGIDDGDIGAWNDLREDGAYLYFLQKCRNVSLDPAVVSALTENTGLSDSMKRTLREDLARLIIVESFTRGISRQGNPVQVYDLIGKVAERAPQDAVVNLFMQLCNVYPAMVLLRTVASFLARVVAFQCGNKSYLKSKHAKLIRSASSHYSTPDLVEALVRMQGSPLSPEAVFTEFVMRIVAPRSQ